MQRIFSALILSLGIVGSAFAGHCPKDAKSIDSALPRSSLTEMEKQKVQAMRDEGMALHKSGDHRQSEKVLAEAMRVLLDGSLK